MVRTSLYACEPIVATTRDASSTTLASVSGSSRGLWPGNLRPRAEMTADGCRHHLDDARDESESAAIRLDCVFLLCIASWMRVSGVDAPGVSTAARALPRLF